MAAQSVKTITWEAPEHHHIEKGSDWYWALGIIATVAAIISLILGNILFSLVIGLGAILMAIVSLRGPAIITFSITARGIRIDDRLYPYATLQSFCIDEEDPRGPQLLLRSHATLAPLIIIPLPPEAVEKVDDILAERLPEEHLEESLAHRLLEFFGF
jgi:hypothetical protein